MAEQAPQQASATHDKDQSYLKGPIHVTFQDGKTYDISFGFNYRIVDPLKFHTNAGDFNQATGVLVPLVRVALVRVLESHSSTSARSRRTVISSHVMKEVSPRFLELGLELSDLGIESFHE